MIRLLKIKLFLFITFSINFSFAQNGTPDDYLNKDFHKNRRDALRKSMPANSVAVFFANPIRNRANDVDFHYHQDPDFYYLTGYKEPDAVLIIFSEDQKDAKNEPYDEVIFVRRRDLEMEQWNGRRLGTEGVKNQLGFKNVFEGKDFNKFNLPFSSFGKVLFFNFKEDVKNDENNASDLFDLQKQFKDKIGFSTSKDGGRKIIYDLIENSSTSESQDVAQIIQKQLRRDPELKNDPVIAAYLKAKSPEERIQIKADISQPSLNHDTKLLEVLMTELREIKTPEEIKLLKKAIDISTIGQIEVMKAMHPEMSETEIQGIHEFVYKKYGAEYEGYPSIVGAGENACVLHYIENNKQIVGNDLVLMDLGAEYRGYTADVTRTIPANGKFSPEQKALYDLVLQAQEASFTNCRPGNPFYKNDALAQEVVNKGLVKLGIIRKETQAHNYFPHGVTHHIGLDVHDRGFYGTIEENMVFTVEPGIYIPPGSPCDKKWWGIGIRIEDDILITKDGYELLSYRAPRTTTEIEALMAKESVLDQFVLPDLD